jgi:hypothetical protein
VIVGVSDTSRIDGNVRDCESEKDSAQRDPTQTRCMGLVNVTERLQVLRDDISEIRVCSLQELHDLSFQ